MQTDPTTTEQDGIANDSSPSFSRNPFDGLRPFNNDESLLFFGRRQQTIELTMTVASSNLAASSHFSTFSGGR